MLDTVFKLLGAGLSLWADKERHKYTDRLLQLKKEFYEEWDKPEGERSDDRLARIERELRLLSDTFASAVGSAAIKG